MVNSVQSSCAKNRTAKQNKPCIDSIVSGLSDLLIIRLVL